MRKRQKRGNDAIDHCSVSTRCTQGESEQQHAEVGQVQRGLLVDLCHRIEGNAEQQRGAGERRAAQERQQDGAHNKVAQVSNARPHGCQAQPWENNKHNGGGESADEDHFWSPSVRKREKKKFFPSLYFKNKVDIFVIKIEISRIVEISSWKWKFREGNRQNKEGV